MVAKLHPFLRKHISELGELDDGMPKDSISCKYDLSQNINYYAKNRYRNYPNNKKPKISHHYFKFLKTLEASRSIESNKKSLEFLTETNVVFMNSAEAINLVINAFCEPSNGDTVCIAPPTFPFYYFCAARNQTPVTQIPLEGDCFDRLNVKIIKQTKPKVVFIPNPNNPVGNAVDGKSMNELLGYKDGLIVIDEAYIAFSRATSLVSQIANHPNLIILRSFSKDWGLAGIRSGAVLANSTLINSIKLAQLPNSFPTHTHEILLKKLKRYKSAIRLAKVIRTEVKNLTEALLRFRFVEKIYPSQANFLLITVTDGDLIYNLLLEHGIKTRKMNGIFKNSLRISLGDSVINRYLITVFQSIENKLFAQDKKDKFIISLRSLIFKRKISTKNSEK